MTFQFFNNKSRRLFAITCLFFAATAVSSLSTAKSFPSVPSSIVDAGKIRVGTKCDYPPEGYLDNSGMPIGVEVSMAHQIAKYAFGEDARAEIVCVTTANRVPALIGGKIDLIIATMGVTPSRAQVVEFSKPYAWASQGMIVRSEDSYNAVSDFDDKPVSFVKGSLAISYFKENHPNVKLLQLDGVSDALQALMTKRVDGYAHDTPVLLTLASGYPKIRLIEEQFKITVRAAAVRPGNDELLKFVNTSLEHMAKENRYRDWFETYANDDNIDVKLNFWDMSKKPNE